MIPYLLPFALLACTDPDYQFEEVEVPDEGSAVSAYEDSANGVRREVFEYGGDTVSPVADYLFVIDESVSMQAVLERFRHGIKTLAQSDAFPSRARIAVMNMTPAEYPDLERLHIGVFPTPAAEKAPGYLGLVDKDGISDYRKVAEDHTAQQFMYEGCDAWFEPLQNNGSGVSCLEANSQIGLLVQGAEAGLNAFKQLLMKQGDEPLFRDGAAANVIFISDTHDPGIVIHDEGPEHLEEALDDLMAHRPDYQELRDLVTAANQVASFRVHAIAPEEPCAEPFDVDDPAYFDVAWESGGITTDICDTTDYVPFIEAMATAGATITEPMFALGQSASEVETVKVNGEPVPFSLDEGGHLLHLDGAVPQERAELEIVYR